MGLSIPLTGCPKFSPLYAAYLGVSLAIVAVELAFLRGIYRQGNTKLFLAWKKFTGYSLPIYYFAHALPRIQWQNADLIGSGRSVFLFALTLLATAAGFATFFLSGRPSTLAAVGVIAPDEAADRSLRKRRAKERKPRGVIAWILDWVDAIAWAAIAVLLVNIFIFQLYEVPSESMVPTFLSGDRPFTLKMASGPRVPLTEWRLPFLRLPQRGDVVTISNPRYPENHRVDLKKYISQFVFMITFTTVHIDSTLPDGTPKADPLVKRIVGLPGEKLMMVVDILYARRKDQTEFQRVSEPWTAVDLWKEPSELRCRIQHLPLDEKTRAVLSKWDKIKADSDPQALAESIASAHAEIEASLSRLGARGFEAFSTPEISQADSELRSKRDNAIETAARGVNPYAAQGAAAEDFSLALAAVSSSGARDALRKYVQGALTAAQIPAENAYEKGSRTLNLIIKANLLNRINRDLSLIVQGTAREALGSDSERARLTAQARELYLYLQGFYDSRNFPEFPQDQDFLARDAYFAMGDNRYNSLDFRFRETPKPRALDSGDSASVLYVSILEPFPLELKFIEGHALFRLWPPSRLGRIH